MKAAVFRGPGDVAIEEVAKPGLEAGEVLIGVRACGICGSDLHTYKHGMFEDLGMPTGSGRVLGHEFSGEVVEINGEVGDLQIGDRVCTVGIGGNAEYSKIPALLTPVIHRIPSGVSFEEAATTEPLATSMHAVNLACPVDGETHVIMGAGIIGLGILQVLKVTSAVRTVVADLSDRRLKMAERLGADVTLNAAREDVLERVLELTGREEMSFMPFPSGLADTVYDCAGLPMDFSGTPVLQQALSMVKQNGRVIVVAIFEKPAAIEYNLLVRKGIKLYGSWAWTLEEFGRSLELMAEGRVDRMALISHKFPLERAREAYETQLRAEEAVKVMIMP